MQRRMFLGGLALLAAHPARAENRSMLDSFRFDRPDFVHPMPDATQTVVMQISDDRPGLFPMALNNVRNVLAGFPKGTMRVVVVAYGPGLKLIMKDGAEATGIAELDAAGVEFDACWNTMQGMAKATGKLPELLPAAVIVPAGVTRILQLQKAGALYLRP